MRRFGFRDFSDRDLAFVAKFKQGELVVEAGAAILLEDSHSPHLYTLLSGWAYRHKTLADGRRQVLNFVLPGELVGVQIAMMNEMQHTVTALTRTTLCVFERSKVWSIFTDHPALGFTISWLAAREEQLLDGHIVNVGQRTALERTAYLALHLYDRATFVGYATGDVMPAPFTQGLFAEALGITAVHLSRTLSKLQARGLMRWRAEEIVIKDRPRLEMLASYAPPPGQARPLL